MRKLVWLLAVVVVACSAQPAGPSEPSAVPTEAPNPSPTQGSRPSPSQVAHPTLPADAVATIGEVRSPISRRGRAAATERELAELVRADTDFAIRLYREVIGSERGNVFLSPYSISAALSMAYAGARGETARQMEDVLGIGPDASAWHAARNRLELELAALAAGEWQGEGDGVPLTLEPVNNAFGQVDYPFRPDFLDTLAAFYGVGMQTVDYIADTEAARRAINGWVAERTRDRIPELIGGGVLSDMTRLVLVNAIYFKANWLMDFDPQLTATESFQLLDGATRPVEMMRSVSELPYSHGDGWQAVRVPYAGASMTIIVPDLGRFAEVEAALDADFLGALADSWVGYEVELGLPRWESESKVDLGETLEAMGMVDLFSRQHADLTGITDADRLFVSDVVHQANITVDEEGTEAAAATAVVMRVVCECGPEGKVTLAIDRPFLYFIQDATAGELLFMGRLLEP
jgi:serpin B